MSAKATSIENFERLYDKSERLREIALKFEEHLFGPAPEMNETGPATSWSPPEGFFPHTFAAQERLEASLYATAEILRRINKQLAGEQNAAPTSPGKLRPMPKADMTEASLGAHLAKTLGETL